MPKLTGIICALLLLTGLLACKSKKEVKAPRLDDLSAEKLMEQLVRGQVKADWMDAKARISFDGTEQSGSATANIVLRKDSLIWMSVRKLGFEVARIQIDQDSVYLINRLGNEYTIQGLDYLANAYNLPANFKSIQAILLGNPVFLNTRDLRMGREETYLSLSSSSGSLENRFWLDPATMLLARIYYGDLRNRREIRLALGDYRPLDAKQKFSYLRQINVNSSELGEAEIKIDFTAVEINRPQEVRFSIPSRYTRVD